MAETMRTDGRVRRPWAVLALLLLGSATAATQHQPFIVHDTKPVITNGPFLVGMSESSVMVVWSTDTPCHSRVVYGANGALDRTAEPAEHGMVPVTTQHAVRLGNLEAGRTYQYQVESTRVVKLKAYWPEKGLAVKGPLSTFRTFDRSAAATSFSVITDTHEDVSRINGLMKLIDWPRTEFLVHTGDAFHWIDSEDQLFRSWLTPISQGLAHTRPLIYARGNHDLRGAFARELLRYVPTPEGRFYYTRDHGPVHLMVVDTCEDKADDTNVYAGLNRCKEYREEELAWFEQHLRNADRLRSAPFRVIVMHQPHWGWVDGQNAKWTDMANRAGVDVVIAGHRHRFSHAEPDLKGNRFHTIVVGQDQVATVDATSQLLKVVVKGKEGTEVAAIEIPARSASAIRPGDR
jgi:predicted phosphodiesterase